MWIQAGKQRLNFKEIASGAFKTESEFENKIFSCCRQWLNGQDHFVITTSGSTGEPKEIQFRRDQLEYSARQTEQALGLKSGYHCLLCLDADFIAGLMMMVRCLVTQMNLTAIVPGSNPFKEIIESPPIDFVSLVPLQLETILSSPQSSRLQELKCALIGGAPLSRQLKNLLKDFHGDWYATYGMTETLSHVALQKLSGSKASDHFTALPGIRITQDERSCLTLQADYLGQEWIVTNDIVTIIGPGQFKWLGRYDHVINSGGRKIIPEALEQQLSQWFNQEQVARRFFIGSLPHSTLGGQVVLIVEGDEFNSQLLGQLESWIRKNLDRYDVPKQILFIKALATTDGGKVDRNGTMNLLPARL
jgi:O-succinylbenzoic acid--CoA ligase